LILGHRLGEVGCRGSGRLFEFLAVSKDFAGPLLAQLLKLRGSWRRFRLIARLKDMHGQNLQKLDKWFGEIYVPDLSWAHREFLRMVQVATRHFRLNLGFLRHSRPMAPPRASGHPPQAP